MYSLTKEGKVIFIPLDKKKKLEFYADRFGLFLTEQEAIIAKKYREQVSKKYFGDLL